MPSCVLAYSGGLDTSVILGWLMDEGYEVHAVYVDLGQPGEDRQQVLDKAKAAGAKSARIVDVRENSAVISPSQCCNGKLSTKGPIFWGPRLPAL